VSEAEALPVFIAGGIMTNTNRTSRLDDNDISTLCNEAACAGDEAMAVLCERALAGDAEARAEVERVIADAAAQEEHDR
jgi:hypothetical protein